MADIGALVERLKNNKLAIPALAVGAIAGGYVLLKKGGLGGGSPSFDTSTITSPDAQPQPVGSAGDTGAADALIQQQQSFAESIVDQFNKFTDQIGAALSAQQGQAQAAIDQLAGQISEASAYQQLAPTQPQIGTTADFSSLFAQLAAIPQAAQQSYQSPGINLGGGGLSIKTYNPTAYKAPLNIKQGLQTIGAKPFTTAPGQPTYRAPTIKLPSIIKQPSIAPPRPKTGLSLGSFNLGSLSGYGSYNPRQVVSKAATRAIVKAPTSTKGRAFR